MFMGDGLMLGGVGCQQPNAEIRRVSQRYISKSLTINALRESKFEPKNGRRKAIVPFSRSE
jgi:hypothetical protein